MEPEPDCEYCCIKRCTPLSPEAAGLAPVCCEETERCVEGDTEVPRSSASIRRAVEGEVAEEADAAADVDGGAPLGEELLSLRCLSQKAKAGFFFAA